MNTTTAKPTPGPWQSITEIVSETRAVYHETGLTPRQLADEVMDLGRRIAETQAELSRIYAARDALADQRAELLAACEAALPYMEEHDSLYTRDDLADQMRDAIARAKAVPK